MNQEEFIEICRSGTAEQVREAIEAGAGGADLNAADENGIPPLLWAAGQGGPEVVTLLLDAGADPGLRDKEGRRALEHARGNKGLKGTDALARLEAL